MLEICDGDVCSWIYERITPGEAVEKTVSPSTQLPKIGDWPSLTDLSPSVLHRSGDWTRAEDGVGKTVYLSRSGEVYHRALQLDGESLKLSVSTSIYQEE